MFRLILLVIVLLIGTSSRSSAEPTCDDLSGIDFGPCDAVLGYGVIDGQCEEISGCESPVPLFDTLEECQAVCETEPTCDDLSGIDFGPCTLLLGFGVINGQCQAISGCESPVLLFSSLEECIDQCEPISTSEETWGRVKARYR